MPRFEDQVVLVTGAGSRSPGIGWATAVAFAAEKAIVVVNDVDKASAESVADEIREAGGRAEAMPFDVTDKAESARAVGRITEAHGPIRVLVNNAGGPSMQPAEEYDSFDRIVGLNLLAPFALAQTVARVSMIPEKRGAIINISSLSGLQALGNDVGYSSSKHGVVGLTKALAVEWAKYGIRVNAIAPGLTANGVSKWKERDPDAYNARIDRVPMRRPSRPEEQAAAVLFLASEDATFVSGVTLPVDGGQMALNSGHFVRHH